MGVLDTFVLAMNHLNKAYLSYADHNRYAEPVTRKSLFCTQVIKICSKIIFLVCFSLKAKMHHYLLNSWKSKKKVFNGRLHLTITSQKDESEKKNHFFPHFFFSWKSLHVLLHLLILQRNGPTYLFSDHDHKLEGTKFDCCFKFEQLVKYVDHLISNNFNWTLRS